LEGKVNIIEYKCDKIEIFRKKMGGINLDQICNEYEKKMKDDKKKFESIFDRYDNRLKELNEEVGINELFLFSILTGRIKTAKTLWKRGKVRFI
jgi:hypothetical protein